MRRGWGVAEPWGGIWGALGGFRGRQDYLVDQLVQYRRLQGSVYHLNPCLTKVTVSHRTEENFIISLGPRPPRGALHKTNIKTEGIFLLWPQNRFRNMCRFWWYQFRNGRKNASKWTKKWPVFGRICTLINVSHIDLNMIRTQDCFRILFCFVKFKMISQFWSRNA